MKLLFRNCSASNRDSPVRGRTLQSLTITKSSSLGKLNDRHARIYAKLQRSSFPMPPDIEPEDTSALEAADEQQRQQKDARNLQLMKSSFELQKALDHRCLLQKEGKDLRYIDSFLEAMRWEFDAIIEGTHTGEILEFKEGAE